MKKLYLFLIVCFLTLSCTTEDEASKITDSINPPNWIQGIWKTEGTNGDEIFGIKFTADDLILLYQYHDEMSYKEEFENFKKYGSAVRVAENISPTFYDLKIIYISGTYTNLTFSKINEHTIIWKINFSDIELKKQ